MMSNNRSTGVIMTASSNEQDRHQCIHDAQGKRTHIVLTLEEYNALLGIYPEEDEEISASEAEAIREGLAEIARGETVSAEEVQRQLNLPVLFPVDKHSRMV
jgi:PHD/YefM family antitoxin component YafN of YafNO toxin-antitoxin module